MEENNFFTLVSLALPKYRQITSFSLKEGGEVGEEMLVAALTKRGNSWSRVDVLTKENSKE